MPTKTQNIASNPNLNILVCASAGTGKTKVLTDRFIRLMLHGSSPERILCLTFTNAAADEMKSRIVSKLSEWENADNIEIMKQLQNIGEEPSDEFVQIAHTLNNKFNIAYDNLKITTIHSLCNEIISRFHNRSKLKILEGYEAKTLSIKSIKNVIEDVFLLKKEHLYSHYLLLSDYMNFSNILDFISKVISNMPPDFSSDFDYIYGVHQADVSKTSFDIIIKQISLLKTDSNMWMNLLLALQKAEQKLADKINEFLKLFTIEEDIITIWQKYIEIFLTQDHKPRQRLVSKEFAVLYQNEFEFLISQQESAENSLMRYKRQISAELNYAIIHLACECNKYIKHEKEKSGFLTFDDLIYRTIKLLKESPKAPGILYELDYEIDHVLVDEAQDNSKEQWDIIKALTEEFFVGEGARNVNRTIFLVGDMKQSIFGFQGASPEEFRSISEFFRERTGWVSRNLLQLTMDVSFRSTKGILDLVNDVCLFNPMCKVNEAIEHKAYRDGISYIEVNPLIETCEEEDNVGWILPSHDEDQSSSNKVGLYISEKISEWISNKRIISGKNKIIEPKDIMILVRKRGDLVSAIKRNLVKHQVPVIDSSKIILKHHIIAQDIISLIKFAISDDDDLNLACLLKSPFFNVEEEELFKLCYNRAGKLLDECRHSWFYDELMLIKTIICQRGILEFLMDILHGRNKIESFCDRFGEEAMHVVSAILEATVDFELKYSRFSYQAFIDWFEESDIPFQIHVPDGINAVRVMTVHGAKGLQSPIVILADAASTQYAPHENIFWHDGVPIVSINSQYDDELIKSLKESHKSNAALETNRLLYVALTRAEDELYVIGNKLSRFKGSWYDIIKSTINN